MEKRPKIKVKKEPLDWLIEIIGVVILLAITGYIIQQFGSLPDRIPSHYGIDGKPDAFGNKSTLLFLLGITVLMSVGMFILNKYPHIFNYPTEITADNAPSMYQKATRMIRSLNTVIVISFSYIMYSTVQTANNSQGGLGNYFIPVFLIAVFGLILLYLYQSFKAAKFSK